MLTINNERIEQRNILEKKGQINMEGMVRRYSQEEEERLLKEITENNEMIIKLQKQIGELQIVVKEEGKRKEREAEARRREKEEEETDRWIDECRKKNEKEREEKEKQKKVDEEWRKIEKMRIKEERKTEKEWR